MIDKQAIEIALKAEPKYSGTPLEVLRLESLSGGSINRAARVHTTFGEYFVKYNQHPLADQFDREMEGLEALRASTTSLRIPKPIAQGYIESEGTAFLILEYLPPETPAVDYDEKLGEGLGELHLAGAERFGFAHDNYCGTTPQPNSWTDDWIPFFREHRLGFQVRRARERGHITGDEVLMFERLLDRLDVFLGADDEPPALIHGDLWSGNAYATTGGKPTLVDPAAYYGHREAELGMMSLFGGFSARVFDAYQAVRPLQAGWRERIELYQLYHVLNHLNLFGGGYYHQALRIAQKWV